MHVASPYRSAYYYPAHSPGRPYHYYNHRYYYSYGAGYDPWWFGVYTPYPSYLPPGPSSTYGTRVAPPYGYGYRLTPGAYQSFYPPTPLASVAPSVPPAPVTSSTTPAGPQVNPKAAMLNVRVPEANAQVWIDGAPTSRQGILRQYVSPPLTPGRKYTYEITARWTENGKEVSQTRQVPIQAGETVNVDFTQPAPPGETGVSKR
jgi:uncharacterized protein (TIGR03000 family)